MAQRVAVFIDYQNVYKGARSSFCPWDGPHMDGQVSPLRTGIRLTAGSDRQLVSVRVYRGMPSSKHDRKGFGACQRQVFEWEKHGAAVLTAITRPINYGDPSAPREKGIDVRLAIDFVMMAMRDEYDVGIIFSGDTDLLPALEAVIALKGRGSVEVAAWVPGGSGHARPLKVKGEEVWCHFLDRADYGRLHDPLDYTRPIPR